MKQPKRDYCFGNNWVRLFAHLIHGKRLLVKCCNYTATMGLYYSVGMAIKVGFECLKQLWLAMSSAHQLTWKEMKPVLISGIYSWHLFLPANFRFFAFFSENKLPRVLKKSWHHSPIWKIWRGIILDGSEDVKSSHWKVSLFVH